MKPYTLPFFFLALPGVLLSRLEAKSSWVLYAGSGNHRIIRAEKNGDSSFQPGSLMKLFAAKYLVDRFPLFDATEEVYCPAWGKGMSQKRYCWIETGHGRVDLRRAIAKSCNFYFYQFARKIPLSSFFLWLEEEYRFPHQNPSDLSKKSAYQKFIGSWLSTPPTLKRFSVSVFSLEPELMAIKYDPIRSGVGDTLTLGTLVAFSKKVLLVKSLSSLVFTGGKTGTSDAQRFGNVMLWFRNRLTGKQFFLLYSQRGKMGSDVAVTNVLPLLVRLQNGGFLK